MALVSVCQDVYSRRELAGEQVMPERFDVDVISIVSPPDPDVVQWPHGPCQPITSRFIHSRNQPPPPVLATTVFPPPEWPLDCDDQTILPVVGPHMALTEEQVEVPPGFGTFPPGFEGLLSPLYKRAERREERREDRRDEREHDERLENGDRRRRRRRAERDRAGADILSDTRGPGGGGGE